MAVAPAALTEDHLADSPPQTGGSAADQAAVDAAWREADAIAAEDVAINRAIGMHGFALALNYPTVAKAKAAFDALADGGNVTMPFGKTFFSKGFGMCVDQFGIPWMVNCPAEM